MKIIKWIRLILRLGLLVVAIWAGIESCLFFYAFHTLTIDDLSNLLALISINPLQSVLLGIGILLFSLSLLGLVMLMQYQIWRYPLSIFLGYAVGAYMMSWFYHMHPFTNESVFLLNNEAWYYPFVMATALLLRAFIGFKLSQRKKAVNSTNLSENVAT